MWMQNSPQIVLITLSKWLKLWWEYLQSLLKEVFLMKFMIHMDNRRADKVFLITCPSGSEHQSSNYPRYADAWEVMTFFKSHFRLGNGKHEVCFQYIQSVEV